MNAKKIMLAALLFVAGGAFAQQIDMSLIPYRSGDKWGYATPEKQIVIQPKYAEAHWFSEGLAAVKVGSKWGYINKTGKLVIPAKFTVAKSFRKGYVPNAKKPEGDSVLFAGASVRTTGEEICINPKGVTLLKCPAINENSVVENRVPVETRTVEKNYSLPNNDGLFDKIVDDYKITGSDETYYVAVKDNRYGIFNSKFDTIVPFQYSSIKVNRKSKEPFLEVNRGGMFGVIMPDGKTSIAPEYTNLVTVNGPDGKEYVIIRKDGKTYVKDLSNRDIISTGYSDIVYDNAGFIITSNDDMRGYYFIDNTVIQPKYKDVRSVNGTKYLMVKTAAGKVGFINTAGDEYFVE